MNDQWSEITSVALEAAFKAGEILKKGFGTEFAIESKPGKQNLVTEYDKAAEKCLLNHIFSKFPDHNILAEESGEHRKSSSPYTWVIDPLDGTVNFAHGVPLFAVSIGVLEGNKPISGVVFHPLMNEVFVAELGKGAFLNQRKIRVTNTQGIERALMATGFPYNVDQNPLHCIDHFAKMQMMGVPIRRLGSAALDLSYVAAGRFDSYWEVSLYPWDMAAGKLIVEEAGGKVTHYDGSVHNLLSHEQTDQTVLATNGHLHRAMIDHLGSNGLSCS